jgi:predicted MPP superfamily phosphohydrolase
MKKSHIESANKLFKKNKAGEKKLPGSPWLYFGGASLLALAAGLFYWGLKVETRRYRLETLRVITSSVVPAANADSASTAAAPVTRHLRILHLSDLHLHANDQEKVKFIRDITNDAYDLVLLSGDVFEFLDGLKFGPQLLSRKPRLGAFAVLGNHDYYDYSIFNKTFGRLLRSRRHPRKRNDVNPHIISLEAGGFEVLVNEGIYLKDENLFLVGIDYPGIDEAKLDEIVERAPEGALKLSLFHLPCQLEQMVRAGIHLGFGGHTHGGQVRLPGVGALITDSELPRHEASGIVRRGDSVFHVSRGLGADPRSNFRLFCPPAATVIELEHSFIPATVASAEARV